MAVNVVEKMEGLFSVERKFPEGFFYFPDFITIEEENDLLNEIRKIELHPFLFQGFEAKRKVASFGYDYNFDQRSLKEGARIPQVFAPLIQKVANKISVTADDFSELLLTEYPPGAVINWHRDAPPFDLIAGISLAAECTFKLRPHHELKRSRSSVISFPVKQRSLYVISGLSRTDWQHSISPVKETRFSITLRTLLKKNNQG